MNKRLLFILALFYLISGCSSDPTTPADRMLLAEQRIDQLSHQELTNSSSANFALNTALIAPEPYTEQDVPVRWSDYHVEFAAQNLAFSELLTELMLEAEVSVRISDGIDPAKPLTLYFSGTLNEALRQLQMLAGVYFEASDYVLTVHRYEVAEFDIAHLAGSTRFFLGDDDAGARRQISTTTTRHNIPQQVAAENSQQYLNFVSTGSSFWDDLQQAMLLLLSAEGQLVISQASTSVLVRDYPQNVALVRSYLTRQNKRLTRQVAIDVQVIDIVFNDRRQRGIDWDMVYQRAANSAIVNFSAAATSTLSGSAALTGLGVEWQSGRLAGSQVLLNVLAEQGLVEVSSHPRVVSLNNQVAKIVLEDNTTYLASTGSTSTANVGSSELLIPGVVSTGFELYILPKVANNQVVMQLSTSLSELTGMERATSGERTIQTPQTSRKTFFMQAMVGDGETLLISGLQSSRSQWRERQTLFSRLLGSQHHREQRRSETILLLTPRVLPTGPLL